MKREWLQAYEDEEQEVARKLIDESLQAPEVDLVSFYKDKVTFKDTYAHEMGVPLNLLLPFYEQVVTKLSVPRDSQSFSEGMGMDVETYASLYERRRLIPCITWPTHYVDLDYLDPLLELKPPTIARPNALVKIILAKRGLDPLILMDFRSEAEKVIFGKYGELANQFQEGGFKVDQQYIETHMVANHVKLKCLGFTEIADRILSLGHPLATSMGSFIYSGILADPIVEGAGGWTQTSENFLRPTMKTDLKLDPAYIFPSEVGRFLTRTYGLDSVISADASTLDKLYVEGGITKARRLLSELDRAVRAKDPKKVADRSLDMEKVFNEARASVSWIDRARKISGTLAIAGIGWGVGQLSGQSPQVTGALGGIIGRLVEQFGGDVASRISNKGMDLITRPLSVLEIAALPLAIWKFEKEWRQAIDRRPPKP